MEFLHFPELGPHILWIILFKREANPKSNLPSIEFLIPSPFGKNEWMATSNQSTAKPLDLLKNFQALCEDAKEICQKQLQSKENRASKAKKASEELESLDILIQRFSELMKYFKFFKRPPKKNPQDND